MIDKLFQIKVGVKEQAERSTFLKKKDILGSGSFGNVYFVESLFDKKLYVLKEI